ncbi:MAG: SIMPL domain-containing protein [Sphingomonadales bacterium]|nr:SIMPL domain-containing protein [Sphingomonadales bacterium]
MVRLPITAAILAFFIQVQVQAAPPALPDVAKGEMLLTVTGRGVVQQQPSRISSICTLSAYAETEEAAKAQLRAKTNQLKANIPNGASFDFSKPVDVSDSVSSVYGSDVAEAAVAATAAAVPGEAGVEAATEAEDAYATISIGVSQKIGFSATSADAFLMARKSIGEAGCDENYRVRKNPMMEISDPVNAKKTAVQAALADAKQKASDYAAALNLQVKAMVAVEDSNAIRAFIGDEMADAFLNEVTRDILLDRNGEKPEQLVVTTSQVLSVQYLLAPK